MLLAHHLSSSLGVSKDLILLSANGTRHGQTHAWLEVSAAIIDITCGQFEDSPDRAIIARGSPWHSQFKGRQLYAYGDFMTMSKEYRREFDVVYETIVSSLVAPHPMQPPQQHRQL
jgi:hypothetical protein